MLGDPSCFSLVVFGIETALQTRARFCIWSALVPMKERNEISYLMWFNSDRSAKSSACVDAWGRERAGSDRAQGLVSSANPGS
jgi:hypothetical protein